MNTAETGGQDNYPPLQVQTSNQVRFANQN